MIADSNHQRSIVITSAFLCLLFFPAPVSALPTSSCQQQYFEIPLGTKVATASFFANFWGSKGSVSYELKKIFDSADKQLNRLEQPDNLCSAECDLPKHPSMYFSSVPLKVLENYSDHAHCEKHFKKTSTTPIHYYRSDFRDVGQLMDWIEDLARGSGREGRDLYSKCDKSCSPRYFYRITKQRSENANYRVSVNIICGHARDKDDNNYRLKHSFRWLCEDKR